MRTEIATEIVVAGSGPVGLTASLALARQGFAVLLAGPRPGGSDRRTTAVMAPALSYLASLGIDEFAEAAPLKSMRIIDGTARLLRAAPVTFHAAEIDEPHFGLNIPNAALNAALSDAVTRDERIEWRDTTVDEWSPAGTSVRARLADGASVDARLAVGADGRESRARQAAGISVTRRSHPQAALVLSFAHTRPHEGISTEFHTESGPFTQVPLHGNRSSLVWVVAPAFAEELAACGDDELSARIEGRMQSMLGSVSVEPGRQVYPLSSLVPDRFAANRVALAGEAAHVFPPIGAQGFNLGVRDVQDLAHAVGASPDDPGSTEALAAYDARRRPDVLARATAVNLLNYSLLTDSLPAQALRGAGLSILKRAAPLRGFFMREGLEPGSGFAAALSTLRKQVGG